MECKELTHGSPAYCSPITMFLWSPFLSMLKACCRIRTKSGLIDLRIKDISRVSCKQDKMRILGGLEWTDSLITTYSFTLMQLQIMRLIYFTKHLLSNLMSIPDRINAHIVSAGRIDHQVNFREFSLKRTITRVKPKEAYKPPWSPS